MEATCPDITFWRTYCAGSITAEQRTAAESHLVGCQQCQSQLISVFDTANEQRIESAPDSLKARALELAPPQVRRPFFSSPLVLGPIGVAAIILLVVGLSTFWQTDTGRPPTTDLRQSNSTTHQIPLTNPPNGAELSSGNVDFRWEDASAGVRYEFILTDEKGDIVFQQRNATSPLSLNTRALNLSPGRKYYWSITGRLPDGTRRESPVAGFTIK